MSKIVIITGLTGSGKSSLAIKIAKKYNGEIISADSVQVYKGLDVGSAKVSKKEMCGVKHHLINIKNFNDNYSVGDFIADCINTINSVLNNGKIPIIVGGTGLYIQALLNGYSLGDAADIEFRNNLEQIAQTHGRLFVWQKLNDLNPQKASTVHPNNLKRVIRYIELEKQPQKTNKQNFLNNFEVCAVGIDENKQQIYEKLNNRVDQLIKSGLENEVKGLIAQGATKDMQSMSAIGYKEWFDYFEGKTDYTTTINLIKQHTRNYCKRQLTFMKTINGLKICTITEAEKIIEAFLQGV